MKLLDKYTIYEIDHKNISEKDMNDLYSLAIEKWQEESPELLKPTFAEVKHGHTNICDSDISEKFIIRNQNDEFVGYATLGYIKRDTNAPNDEKIKAWTGIRIREKFRNNGIGTEILKLLIERASRLGMKKIISGARSKSGKNFCEKFGGRITARSYYSFLNLDTTDFKKIKEINHKKKDNNKDIKLKTFFAIDDDKFESHFEKIAEYMEEISKYSDDWKFDRDFFLAEVIPDEKKAKERGVKKPHVYAYYNDKIIGVSELRIEPENPKEIYTELTGVDKDFRGRGLCKLLKTELLLYIRENFPDTKLVTTGNDEDNSLMRSVNKDLGFKQLDVSKGYMFELDNLKKRLGA